MSETATLVLNAALSLSEDERVVLRDALDESLRDDPDPSFDAMVAKRVQQIRAGQVKGIPASEVMDRLRKKYQK